MPSVPASHRKEERGTGRHYLIVVQITTTPVIMHNFSQLPLVINIRTLPVKPAISSVTLSAFP